MKRCPECRRDYYDDTLTFCLADGSQLVYGLSDDEPATAILSNDVFATEVTVELPTVTPKRAGPANSIAVLPFTNMSADVENEYFCDGLAEELLNSLSKIDELKVAARTSAFSFKDKGIGVAEIGEKLGVSNILEGSVRRSGGQLRISIQVVNASDGFRIWSERYDHEMTDIFTLQDEITLAVVNALKLKLFGVEKARVLKKGTDSTGAYEFYLRGLFYLNKRTAKGFERSVEFFTEAIELDPNYALAYAGLADAYVLLGNYGVEDPNQTRAKAREAAFQAISIDGNLAEAHTALGTILLDFDHDFISAESEYKRAIEAGPNNAPVHHLYGQMLSQLGRHEEALAEIRKAMDIDPLSIIIAWVYGSCLFVARKYEDAILQLQKVAESEPSFALAHYTLAVVHMVKGEYDMSVEEFVKYKEVNREPEDAALLRESYRDRDWKGFLRTLVDERIGFSTPWHNPAILYAALDENEKAFAELNNALEQRDPYILMLKVDPRLDTLRGDPRYESLVEKAGLPNRSY